MSLPPTLSGKGRAHVERELADFLALIQQMDCRSYLEIGCRDGDTFALVADILPAGARMTAIDLPGAKWGRKSSRGNLEGAIEYAKAKGHRVTLHLADSHLLATRALLGFDHFDCVFIDGDHTYAGVSRDWQLYGPLADRLVAFHDIVGEGQGRNGNVVEVPRFWRELVEGGSETREIVAEGSVMGIGVVMTQPRGAP